MTHVKKMFDSHCHLQVMCFVDDVLKRARDVGVRNLLCCATRVDDWDDVAKIGEKYDGVICAFGIHPWYVDDVCENENWENILRDSLSSNLNAVVGEIGLDKNRFNKCQHEIFVKHINIADEFKRPASIHCRNSWGELLQILRDRGGLRYGGAIHAYSGSAELVSELCGLGCYISFSGSILNAENKKAASAINAVPLNKLLVETDSPDMLPKSINAQYNEPAYLPQTLRKIAEIKNISFDEIAQITYNNALNVFAR